MERKQWRIFLAMTVMAGVLGAMGCGNKAETSGTSDDAVAVMANAEIDGEMQESEPATGSDGEPQTGMETQTGAAEAGSSGERQDSEPATEASTPLTSQAGNLGNSMEESLPKCMADFINVNLNLAKSTIEGIKLERKEAQARAEAEAERKEAERKEAEAREAEEKAQAEAAAISATATSASSHSTEVRTIPANEDITLEAGIIYLDYSLLEKVNADRANNGVAALQWSDSLSQYCADRIPVIKYNIRNGIWAHEGFTQTENLAYGAVFTSSEANQGWINSEGHHNSRINSEYTMYAAAVYYDNECIIWIEAFE